MSKITGEYFDKNVTFGRAVVGYLLSDGQVILGLRKKVSMGLGENLISGIGGKVGDIQGLESESDDEALLREVQEEIDVTITSFKKVGEITFLFPNKPKWNQFVVAYIVNSWSGIPKETETIKPVTFSLNQLPVSQMWDDNKYWVPLVLNGKSIRAKFVYADDNRTVKEKFINEVKRL